MTGPTAPERVRVTWIRWEGLGWKTSHPWRWEIVEPDGYVRQFDTRRDALAWIADNYPEES